jgi:hypothetical protein
VQPVKRGMRLAAIFWIRVPEPTKCGRENLRPQKRKKPLVDLPEVGGQAQLVLSDSYGSNAKPPNPQIRGSKRQAAVAAWAITSAIVRWLVKTQLSPSATSRAAVARLDSPPGTMCWEADHGIPNMSAGAAGLAGRVGRGADRYASPGGCAARQRRGTVTPLTDRLGPLVAPSLKTDA